MTTLAIIAAALGGVLHVVFWVAEALLWKREAVWRTFGARSAEEAAIQAPVFYNIGFYNLFVGLGAIAGAILVARDQTPALLIFTCLFMVGAGLVLLTSSRSLWRGAMVQAVPGVVALVAMSLA